MSNFQKYLDLDKAAAIARESASIREGFNALKNDIRNPRINSGLGANLGELVIRALDNDAKRYELAREAGAKHAADVTKAAETVGGKYKLLAIGGWTGRGRNKVPCTFYVTGFSFESGPGMHYKTVSFSKDRSKAQRFSLSAAVSFLDQLARNYTDVRAVPSND